MSEVRWYAIGCVILIIFLLLASIGSFIAYLKEKKATASCDVGVPGWEVATYTLFFTVLLVSIFSWSTIGQAFFGVK